MKIVYVDDDILAVNKPPGLLSVPGLVSPDNLYDQVRAHYPNARVVHRLDMATSGLILFALNHTSQTHLSKQFEHKHISKTYLAVVEGNVPRDNGQICVPMLCDWPNRPKQKVDWLEGKFAQTYFKVAQRKEKTTKLILTPVTGRSHQLRVHCAHMGHPIVGDELYGKKSTRLMLQAAKIDFTHPGNLENLELKIAEEF